MFKLDKKNFTKIVQKEIDAIPKKFLHKLNNLAIVVEKEPTLEQKKKLKLRDDCFLFGLYEGVPQTLRGNNYTFVLPDKITIFQKSIETFAQNKKDIEKIIRETLWHEIAHHFGMDEKQVRQAKVKKISFKKQ